jgi:hypothetical protein
MLYAFNRVRKTAARSFLEQQREEG